MPQTEGRSPDITTLLDRFLSNTGRTIHKLDHYFPIYERHFARFVGKPVTMIEIGCGLGGSLRMWKDYLGPQAVIVGLDYRPECMEFEEPQVLVRIGKQGDIAFLASVLAEFGTPDIVLDDGSHLGPDQRTSFEFLYLKTSPTGVYMVEDLHCAYLPQFDGGRGRDGTFIEYVKPLVDEINGSWWNLYLAPGALALTTNGIHIYDSIVAFERAPQPARRTSRRVPEPRPGTQIAWPRPA